MGTRNLTCVIKDGDFRVAQYGQWDGYPSGAGANILAFLAEADMNQFNDRVRQCKWMDNAAYQKRYKELGFPEGGLMNMNEAERFKREFPLLSRDVGSDILRIIYEGDDFEEFELNDSREFAADSLFCEWAYVVDLDREVFEVYKGFNHDPNANAGAFATLKPSEDNARRDEPYYTVTLVKSYPLDELPTVEQLEAECDPEEEE